MYDDARASLSACYMTPLKKCLFAILATRFLYFWQEKCSQYWPEKNGRRSWGHFTTESVSEEKVADYVVRQFSLRNEVRSSLSSPSLRNRSVIWMSNASAGNARPACVILWQMVAFQYSSSSYLRRPAVRF